MATQVQNRRGSTAEHSTFTGAVAELTVDTDKDVVVVHDGSTAGGHPMLKQDLSNLPAGTIDNADINASAAIAGTKISPNFGSQNVTTTGTATAAALIPSGSSVPTNGVYLPSANNVAISTNGTPRVNFGTSEVVFNDGGENYDFRIESDTNANIFFVDASANAVGIGTTSPQATLSVSDGTVTGEINPYSASSTCFIGTRSNHAVSFQIQASEKARIDTSGRFLVGTSSSISTTALGNAQVQVVGTTNETAQFAISRFSNDADRGRLAFIKSRGASGTNTIVQADDAIGRIEFLAADGSASTAYPVAAHIGAFVDGTPGANDMPGRLVFSTTADGAASPTERMRIQQNGIVTFATSPGSSTPGVGINPSNSRIYGNFGSGGGIEVNAFDDGTTGGRGFFAGSTRGDGRANRIELVPGTNGAYLADGATSWSSLSDENSKTDFVDIDNGLTKVASLRSVTGRYITDDQDTRRSFLIAQDVEKVLPEAVDRAIDEEGNLVQLGLRYTDVIPLLVTALKESKERIETLEAKVAALEAS